MKVRAVLKLPDGRQMEIITEPEALAYITVDDVPAEDLEVISIEMIE